MADSRNLILQLLITAKDEASGVFSKVFKALNDSTNVIATKVREGFANLFGGAVDSAAEFEQQLGKVQAKGDKTYQDTEALKKKLQELAAQFGVTGTTAAQGLEVLAAAGLNATDAMNALPAVLNLATIENLSLDDAATKLSDTLSIVGLGFGQAGRMADVLAKGANISTASAAGLAEALTVAGGQAKSAGLDLEATVAALDLLAKAGIKGSAAGTSLAAILTQLQNPASAASKELNKLGINTRDLGGVLDGLKGAGVQSGAAILAFGETAGPGLQAMISQGSAGLKDFDTQLRDAKGSAQTAADQLNNNFNGALSSLAAAWDSVKVAVAEPILKPIADGAREVAKALNEALNNGALKPVQAAIKGFAENGVASIREFVGSFDFSQVMPALRDFATSAGEWLGNIKTAGQTAGDVVSGVWNTLAATFYGVATAVSGVATLIVGDFALIVSGLNKIGLVSDETQAQWVAGFEAMKRRTEELAENAVRDGKKAGAAFARLGTDTDQAGVALEKLKNKLPTRELEELQAQVTAYADALKAANPGSQAALQYATQLKEAQAALDKALGKTTDSTQKATGATADLTAATTQAKPAIQQYDALWQKTGTGMPQLVEAHLKLGAGVAEVTRVVGVAQPGMSEWNGTLVKSHEGVTKLGDGLELVVKPLTTVAEKTAEYNRQIKAGNDNAAEWRSGMALNEVKMLGLRDAVQATAEKLAYLQSIQATLPDADRQIAEATAAAKAALDRYNTALVEHIDQLEAKKAAVERSNTLEQKGYDLLIQQARAEGELAAAKGDTETATRKEIEAIDLQNQQADAAIAKKTEEIAAYADLIAATREKLAADGELNAADQAQLATMADTLTGMEQERQSLAQTAESTRELAEATKKASEEHQKATSSADGLSAKLGQITQSARANMGALSEQAKVYFDMMTGVSAGQYGIISGFDRAREASSAFNAAMSDGEKEMVKFRSEITAANYAIKSADESLSRSTGSLGVYLDSLAKASAQTTKLFYEQKLAAKELELSITDMAENGSLTMASLQIATRRAGNEFSLLDEEDLSGLTSALDKANQKLREMQEETQSAAARLAELNAEIAAEKGDTATADRLKLELDQQQQLAEVEAQLAQARAQNNRELIALYEEQKQRLQELYSLKERNLEADIRAREEEARAERAAKTQTTSSSGGSGSGGSSAPGGKVYNLNLTGVGGKTLTTTTATDPGGWLEDLERARRGAA